MSITLEIMRMGERIAELEKENAELNKKLFKAEEEYDKMFWNKNEIISKAKELIKDFLSLDIFGIFKGTTAEEIVDKAEQFISEVENV